MIITSRDYIYAAAEADLKHGAFPLLNEASVVIEVEAFSTEEREQILYNHLRLGNQSRSFKRHLAVEHLEEIAADNRVQAERRVVQNQQLRVGRDRQRQRYLGPLTVRQPADL